MLYIDNPGGKDYAIEAENQTKPRIPSNLVLT